MPRGGGVTFNDTRAPEPEPKKKGEKSRTHGPTPRALPRGCLPARPRRPAAPRAEDARPPAALAREPRAGDDRPAREARGRQVEQVVEPRADLAKVLEGPLAIAEHRVGGVDRAVDGGTRQPEREVEAHGRDERVGQVLGDRLDRRRGDVSRVERGRGPAHEVTADGRACRGEVAGRERRLHAERGGGEAPE